jgi:hypothetical protein
MVHSPYLEGHVYPNIDSLVLIQIKSQAS